MCRLYKSQRSKDGQNGKSQLRFIFNNQFKNHKNVKKIIIASTLIVSCFLTSCKSHKACAAYKNGAGIKEVKKDKTERNS